MAWRPTPPSCQPLSTGRRYTACVASAGLPRFQPLRASHELFTSPSSVLRLQPVACTPLLTKQAQQRHGRRRSHRRGGAPQSPPISAGGNHPVRPPHSGALPVLSRLVGQHLGGRLGVWWIAAATAAVLLGVGAVAAALVERAPGALCPPGWIHLSVPKRGRGKRTCARAGSGCVASMRRRQRGASEAGLEVIPPVRVRVDGSGAVHRSLCT